MLSPSIDLIDSILQYFSYIMATSFSGGRSWSTRREPSTMGKQLVNFITGGCESSAPFFVIYKAAVLVIALYELLGNPTTQLIEPPRPLSPFTPGFCKNK
jgi:hypothetical protein